MFKLNEFSFEKLIQKYGGHCLNKTIIQLGFGTIIDGAKGRRIRVKLSSNSFQCVKKPLVPLEKFMDSQQQCK